MSFARNHSTKDKSYSYFVYCHYYHLNIGYLLVLQYSALRGVYGTPTFFVNGFQLPDPGSPLDFNGWKAVIDPLIGHNKGKKEENLHFFL